jgi:phytoene dehydrogenase-like protein
MVEKFEQLGGKITYKKRVEKIIVENNVAKGVILTDGTKIDAGYVISAAMGILPSINAGRKVCFERD